MYASTSGLLACWNVGNDDAARVGFLFIIKDDVNGSDGLEASCKGESIVMVVW